MQGTQVRCLVGELDPTCLRATSLPVATTEPVIHNKRSLHNQHSHQKKRGKKRYQSFLSVPCETTEGRQSSASQVEGSYQNHTCWCLSGFPSFRTVRNKWLWFKPPRLKYFITAVQPDQERHHPPNLILNTKSNHGMILALSHIGSTSVMCFLARPSRP